MKAIILMLISMAQMQIYAQQIKEPSYIPPLASGGAPECPTNPGTRKLIGRSIASNNYQARIVGVSMREPSLNCKKAATLEISGSRGRKIDLLKPSHKSFSIVDFSPDSSSLLIMDETAYEYPNELFRYVSLAKIVLPDGSVEWENVWDLFGWSKCDAAVEPQGFTDNGLIIIRVRPSFMSVKRRKDCINDIGLYSTDLHSMPIRLPDNTVVKRYGKISAEASQACRTDPDIIGDCFSFRGRLAMYNGNPTLRIWRVGTTRILGTRDDPLPGELEKRINWDVEAWGNFTVCPYTKEEPGVMQTICIDSADQVIYKTRN